MLCTALATAEGLLTQPQQQAADSSPQQFPHPSNGEPSQLLQHHRDEGRGNKQHCPRGFLLARKMFLYRLRLPGAETTCCFLQKAHGFDFVGIKWSKASSGESKTQSGVCLDKSDSMLCPFFPSRTCGSPKIALKPR